jgi:hypothetical protein
MPERASLHCDTAHSKTSGDAPNHLKVHLEMSDTGPRFDEACQRLRESVSPAQTRQTDVTGRRPDFDRRTRHGVIEK